jgi:autotransporter translocation and assembly factor TamB
MKNKKFPSTHWILAYLIGALFFSIVYLFLNTQKGLDLALVASQRYLPGHLKIARLKGSLLGPIQIKNLHYNRADCDLLITYAQFAWDWPDLLRGRITIKPLFIDKLTLSITKNATTPNTKNLKLPWVLSHIRCNAIDIHQALIRYGDNVLSLTGSLHEQWYFNWQLIIPQVGEFIENAKGRLVLQGNINGTYRLPKFAIYLPETDLSWQDWQLKHMQSKFYVVGGKNKNLIFALQAAQLKNATFSLNPLQLNLTGHLASAWPEDLLSVKKFLKTLKQGDMAVKLDSGAYIPTLGLQLKNITIKFHTNKNILQGDGQLNSGKGLLTFQSITQLHQAKLPSLIALQGDNVEISHTEEYKITASPRLAIQANTQHIEVSGHIFFPQAKINIHSEDTNVVELSSDVVFIHQANYRKKSFSLPVTYKNNVQLQLGDACTFSYQGLHTQVNGSLDVQQTSGHPTLATGELTLSKGNYNYYGQQLILQAHSSLNFANSRIENPSLNITASKSVWVLPNVNSDIAQSNVGSTSFIASALQTQQAMRATVGIHLQGYLENPQLILYAEPDNIISSQLDILSYLTTGQPSNQLNAGSLQLLLNAATHLGGNKTSFSHLLNRAQKKIGIDQLSIGINPIFNPNTNSVQQNTSLIIGKNFSPRLNVSYSLGLLDPISILQINYLLNKNFSLQSTNSNFANGIDLLYKIEKK